MVGFRNEFIGDITMDAKSSKTATLTIGNKNYDFPILSGTVGPDVIDIGKLYGQAGVFTYDPGFTSTGSCQSKITYIDGDAGVLEYRGYPIEQLAEHGDFLETCYLLLYGELPTPAQKNAVETWEAFPGYRDEGLTRSIGVSNFDYRYLPEILDTGIIPAVDQIELHPQFQQIDTRPLLAENDIKIEAWGPLGQGNVDYASTVIGEIGRAHV